MEENNVTELDLIYEAHDKVDVLIELLIDKGVITLDEYNQKLEEYIDRMESESDEDQEE